MFDERQKTIDERTDVILKPQAEGSRPASSSWRSVAVLERSDRIRSIHFILALVLAFLLTACTSYYDEFAEEYGYGKSSKGYEFDGATLTDLRDEHTYNVAKVGNLYWMLDNVAYKFYRNHERLAWKRDSFTRAQHWIMFVRMAGACLATKNGRSSPIPRHSGTIRLTMTCIRGM